MKTTEDILQMIAMHIGHIYFRPLLYGRTAEEIDLSLSIYHSLWLEIALDDSGKAVEASRKAWDEIGYKRGHPGYTEGEAAEFTVGEWRLFSEKLGVPIPYEEIRQLFHGHPVSRRFMNVERKKSVDSLFSRLIDYAGLFPPAGLPMGEAVKSYATYRQGEQAWMLGRFIVPVAQMGEFEVVARHWLVEAKSPWQLSVLGGNDARSDLAAIKSFNERYAGRAVIDAVEVKTETAAAIESWLSALPVGMAAYCEVPLDERLPDLLAAISGHEGCAKIRTGGVTPDAIPSAATVAHFIRACVDADVAFKATAGLHHPVRSMQRLTEAPDSPTALMHGFLNVWLVAGFAQFGESEETLIEILEEQDPQAFSFDNGGIRWRGNDLVLAHVRNTRSMFAHSFGSCSFAEPIADLQKLGLL